MPIWGSSTKTGAMVSRLRAIERPVLPSDRVLRNDEHWELLVSGLRLAAGEDT